MRPITLLLIIGAFLTITPAFAQQHTCGTEQLHSDKMKNDPTYRLKMDDFEGYLQRHQFTAREQYTVGAVTVYRIPLVFHVMHKGEAYGVGSNITKEAILNSIQALNSRYRKILGGIGDGNGVDINIEFSLAVRDPNGNCTDAIVRYDMSGNAPYMSFGVNSNNTNGLDDAALKSLSFWDSNKYYNVWVISEIDDNNGGSGTQGYAYYAAAHGASTDGAVMLANCIKDTTTITLAHELGHALNLYHTFEN